MSEKPKLIRKNLRPFKSPQVKKYTTLPAEWNDWVSTKAAAGYKFSHIDGTFAIFKLQA